ncbi:hypothetical protein F2P79_002642 [Pimephales promelas]|nr:hypothetical protein F2P79_002642 [Pimephales promelas]
MSSQPAIYSLSKSSAGPWFGGSTGFASQGMSSTYSGSVQSQDTASQFASGSPSYYPSVSLSSPQGSSSQSATAQSSRKQFASSYGTQLVSSKPFTLQGSATYGGSFQPQGTASQFVSGSPSSNPSVSLSLPQGSSSQSATAQSSRKQFASSYGTQLVSSKPLTLQGSTTYGGSLQPQGTKSQFVSGSPSSYPSASLSLPQGSSSQSATAQSSQKQFTSTFTGNSGTQEGPSAPFKWQGSTTYGGSLQPQGTTSQFASGSPSSYPSVSLSSPQGSSSQSATAQSSRKQFASNYGTQLVSSKPFTLQGSATYGGSFQPQGTASQFVSGSPSSNPSVSLSLPQGSSSQSATAQSSRKQFASSYGNQLVSSKPLTLQGSTTYGGSLQPQGTTSQFVSGSPSSYPSVSLSSPQGSSSQSAIAQSSRKQFASSYGTQLVSSKPLTLQGSTTYGGSLQPQGTKSQFVSGSPSSYPSVSLSLPQGSSSQSATAQSSRKQFASSYGTQLVSSKPFTLQGSATYGGSLQPQGTASQFVSGSPSSYLSASLSLPQGSSSQSATAQSSQKQFTSTFTGNSGTQEGPSAPFKWQGSTTYGGSLQPQGTTSQFVSGSPSSYPSVSLSSPQGSSSQSATAQSSRKQFASSYGNQLVSSKPLTLQGSTTFAGSLQPQGTTSQFVSGSPSSYPSVSLSSPQGSSSQSATAQSSRKQFASSYGTQLVSSKPFTLQGSATYGGSLQPQGTASQFVSGSPSSYLSASLSLPQGSSSQSATAQSSQKQFTSTFTGNSGTQEGPSAPFKWQGSTTYGGSLQPQGTTSQFVSGSPSSYPSVSLSSPQGSSSQSATAQSSRKQFASSYGNQLVSSKPLTLQGSTTFAGSLQPQGTTSQFVSGSPSSYPSVSLSLPQGSSSQSAIAQSSRKQFASSYGTQLVSSKPLTLKGSTTYGGSLQPQGTTSQFVSGSPSSYPSVSLSSPQGSSSQSATAQSSRKQFASSYGTQLVSSKPFTLQGSATYGGSLQPQGSSSQSATAQSSQKQFTSTFTGNSGTQEGPSAPFKWQGSTTYGGSLQPQGTTSQFVSGSPSSYPSVSLSSPQGSSSQSATAQSSRKQFASSYGNQLVSSKPLTLQGSTTFGGSLQPQGTTSQFVSGSPSSYPSVSLSLPQGSSSQSAIAQSSRKQFASSYGTQLVSSKPLTLKGSTTYGGSLQPQGTTSQFVSGSPSSYPSVSLSLPQGSSSQSATAQSSQKQFTSNYGSQLVSSKPFTLQGATTYGGSLQPQGTTSQFDSRSRSSYPIVALSSPQGSASHSAAVQSSQKRFTSTFMGNSGTQEGPSAPFKWQGSTTYSGSLQPQVTSSQFASGSPSSYPSVSLFSPQGFSSQSATAQSSQKQFASNYGSQLVSSKPFTLQGATTYGGSLQRQGTTSQFASGSPSSYPIVTLSSPQGSTSHSAAVQSSQKRFTSTFMGNSGTQEGPSGPFKRQGSTTYGGSLQLQGTTSQFASGSPSYPSVSLFSPQGASSQSAAVQSSRKQFASSYATQSGSSKPFTVHTSRAYSKLGSSSLAVSSQSTSDKQSNGLYSSDSLQTQGLSGVIK